MMDNTARDYRTVGGVSRRHECETILAKYIRVARVDAPHLSQTYPLPIARPEIDTDLDFDDYIMLIDVLDELFILEAAARYTDRKSADIARRRLYRAIAQESDCSAKDIETFFVGLDRNSLPKLRRIAHAILPIAIQGKYDRAPTSAFSAEIIAFPIRDN